MRQSSTGYRVAVTFMIAAVVATVLPAIFGKAPVVADGFKSLGDPWHDFVYNFQTLITGLAAVAAAFFTVRQMNLTDIEQGRRHGELVALSLRGDRLRLERALNPQYSDLIEIWTAASDLDFDRSRFEGKRRDELYVDWLCSEVLPITSKINSIVGRAQFRDGASLFGGVLSARLLILEKNVNELQTKLKTFQVNTDTSDETQEAYLDYDNYIWQYFPEEKKNIFDCLAGLTDVLPAVINQLENVAKEYSVKLEIGSSDGSTGRLRQIAQA